MSSSASSPQPSSESTTTQRQDFTLRIDGTGRLRFIRGDDNIAVTVRPCFPWSSPREYISLRRVGEKDDSEVALVPHLEDLDSESRRALEQVLGEAGFMLEVTGIEAIERDFELRTWKVQTRQGPRSFQTKLEDWPIRLPSQGIVLRDLGGDLYHIADPHGLDKKSFQKIWAFLD
ncbi:MAG: DUF1854 domain-containing protein [Opitutales bacterium]